MKTIDKRDSYPDLQNAKARWHNWDAFVHGDHARYLRLRKQIIEDQKDECAYTGLWIGDGCSHKVHLDHFKKKSIYPEYEFSGMNLFGAVKNDSYGSDFKDARIHGTKPEADSMYESFWSPTEENLADKFWYQQDGSTIPSPSLPDALKEKANKTIEMFNLNAPELKNRRLAIMKSIRAMGQLEDDEIRKCLDTMGFSCVIDFELKQR